MRWFWSAMAILAAVGLWFALRGPSEQRASIVDDAAPAPAPAPARDPTPEPTSAPTPVPVPVAAPSTTPPAPTTLNLLGDLGGAPARTLATDTRTPAEVTRRIDARTIELDGRFRAIGNGSPDDPYRISWELLTSAGPFVDPAQHALVPPPWVRALDGSFVEISAYYSTAVRATSASKVLLTLNRWDGCCIGLPPTPFDAIDASLASPLDMKGLHLFRFGTFRGRLVVEPFAAGSFLLGLYRLEDASLVTQ